jgi:hypothetical protein
MGHTFAYVFLTIYALGAAWLVTSGLLSFYTKQCTFWVGGKVFSWSGNKAYWGGAFTTFLGLCLLALAVMQFRSIFSQPV